MIIHGARVSPFVRKVLVFASEKGIETEARMAGFGRGDPGYLDGSPFGKIPALEDGDFLLCDSTAIITYMDALHPEPNLIPTEAKARARTIWFEEFGDTIAQQVGQKIFFNRAVAKRLKREPDLAAADLAEAEEMPKIYDYLEKVLPESGWLVEDRFTLADLAAACPIINVGYCSDGLDAARWPRVAAWLAAVKARPSMAAALEEEAPAVRAMLEN
ncbi:MULTISPECIES: glutathione S-transferase family protein [Sphingobium]|jgi:glutathione S-transferase|uniref:glutathione S-transferase family protein n=1 Tax=Sphingobium TaxID=165695 RepID=UPI000C651C23|nr:MULTISPECIES: glutathione S-transferase family protein [Sphingobium]MBA37562.1 glutathione S-transferase [Sphingobium sp.]MBS46296.1 glutathione S-transferase [Sphingobium sp.]MCC4255242.1 glutathione S-transferase family protein [Sphingobium lactosutens]HCW60379.1 glutathione S-transferase [Sphingobium sp.]